MNYANSRYKYFEDTTQSDNKNCLNIFLGITLFVVGILFVGAVVIPFYNYNGLEQHTCYIDKITYPETLPYHTVISEDNITNVAILRREYKNNGWKKCNCGFNCSGWISCIDMYTNISYKKILNNYSDGSNVHIDKYDCTYYNNDCVSKESELERLLNYSFDVYKNNYKKNVICFYDKNITNIYLHKYFDTSSSLIISILFGCSFIILIIVNVKYYCDIKKKQKETQFYQILPSKL